MALPRVAQILPDGSPAHLRAGAAAYGLRRRSGLALAVLALAVLAFGAWKREALLEKLLDLRYGATLAPPAGPAPRDALEARRLDLDYLARLTTIDRSFPDAARVRFAAAVARLQARAASLTDAQFFLGVAEAVALAGNAHTNVDERAWRERLNSVPVRLAPFEEGWHIVRATKEHQALLGARVLAIDGLEPVALEREAARFFGGTPEHVHAVAALLLESPQALNVLHPAAPEARWRARLAWPGGRVADVDLAAVAPQAAPEAGKAGLVLSPWPMQGEKGRWSALLAPGDGLPPSLREPARSAYARTFDGGHGLYLHLWRIRDDDSAPLAREIGTALGRDDAPRWRTIVLDLRFDSGGDYPTIYASLAAIGRRLAPDGRLLILEDNTTFSAGIISAVLARHFAGDRATLVGERPGDRLRFWAEGTPTTLPASRIRIGVSTGYHDWRDGCRELRCWWPNFLYDVAGHSVEPDVRVGWRFDDYRSGVDTVLERALRQGAPR